MTIGLPLVSVLVTTRNRPHLIPQMIRCFQHQTYPNKELVVVDGGDESVEHLCTGDPSIRYLAVARETTRGACLNRAAEVASGDILQRIDDDDYYHPRFMERAAATLRQFGDDDVVVVWDCFYIFLAPQTNLRFSGHRWAAGSTFCFRRHTWEQTRFRDERVAEDFYFLQDTTARVHGICAPELFMLVRHGRNTWRKMGETGVDDYFRSLPACGVNVADVVDPRDLAFYTALGQRE